MLAAQPGERGRIAGRLRRDLRRRREPGGDGQGHAVEEVAARDRHARDSANNPARPASRHTAIRPQARLAPEKTHLLACLIATEAYEAGVLELLVSSAASVAGTREAEDGRGLDPGLPDELHQLPNVLGATGAIFYVVSMSMKTAIPLRITSLVSVLCLLGSSILARSLPAITLYAVLLPVHSIRLYQMFDLIKKVRAAAGTDLSMDWLRPYMKKRKYREGDILFRKGDPADEMFLVGKGRYRVLELDNELRPGQIFGELGL